MQKQRKKNMAKASYIGIAAAFLLIGIVGVIVWLTGGNMNRTVLTVGNHRVKKDLYTCVYYYDTMASKNWQESGFDTAENPYEQAFDYYAQNEKFESWGAYFEKMTNDTLRFLFVMTDLAQEGGYTYTDDVQTHIETEISGIESEKGTAKNFETYMFENYGAVISKKTLKQYLELYYRATEFYKAITESKALFTKYMNVNADVFEKTYAENKDAIDVVSFRYFSLDNNKSNAAKIEALKQAADEKSFQSLCNQYKNDEAYTKNDSSLFENYSLKTINTLSTGEIAKHLSEENSKAGDIYYAVSEVDKKSLFEIVFVVKSRAKNTSLYQDSEVEQWEFDTMGLILEEYYDKNYTLSISDKGIEEFKDSMIIPA